MRLGPFTLRLVVAMVIGSACASPVGDGARGSPGTEAPATATAEPVLRGASCEERSGGDQQAAMFLTDIRVAGHEGFDRVTFAFTAHEGQEAQVPYYRIGPVDSPLLADASGDELDVDGSAFVRVVAWASGVDLSGPEPREVYTGPRSIRPPDTANVAEVRDGGDFENVITWYVGTRTRSCFVVSTLTDPVRIVLDVATRPASPGPSPSP